MIRKIGVAVISAALVFGTAPAYACTGISLKATDSAAIRGRTLEFGFPLRSNVIVIPAGQKFSGTLPDGSKGLSYTTQYAVAGANALDQTVIIDGINDQGLSIGLFYFPDYAEYTDVTPENAKHALAPYEFGLWVLGNFATVDEVKQAVKDVVLAPTPFSGFGSGKGSVPAIHFFIQDKSGKSIVVEPVERTLKVSDAPLGVITNAPTYEWHIGNLSNYVNLSPKDVSSAKLGPVTINAFGTGTGLLGLPGDFTPPSRFVRAAIFSQSATPTANADEAVLAAFHILNQFDIPKGSVRGPVVNSNSDEITEWTSVADLKNLRWYFRTFEDQSIHMVDLKQAVDAAKGKVVTIKMQGLTQPIANTSTDIAKGN